MANRFGRIIASRQEIDGSTFMRPDEKRKTKPRSGVARARTLLKKHVGWLPGYPISVDGDRVVWQSVHWDRSGVARLWVLSDQDLRQAQMTITKLRHHFPKALPKIVDHVDDWLARVDSILAILKATIHDGRALNRDQLLDSRIVSARWIEQYKATGTRHPKLGPLLDAIGYLEFSKRTAATLSAIEWIDAHADALAQLRPWIEDDDAPSRAAIETHTVLLQLRFCNLRHLLSQPLFETLVRAYADPAIRTCRVKAPLAKLEWLEEVVSRRLRGRPVQSEPENESPVLISEVDSLLRRMEAEKPKRQKVWLRLLGLWFDHGGLDEIRNIQQRIESRVQQLSRLDRQLVFDSPAIPSAPHQRRSLAKQIERGRITAERDSMIAVRLASCLRILPDLDVVQAGTWIRFLRKIPADHWQLRSGLFCEWMERLPDDQDGQRSALLRVLTKLESVLRRRGVGETVLKSWQSFVDSDRRRDRDWIVELCEYHANDHRLIDQALQIDELVSYEYDSNPSQILRRMFADIASVTQDADQAAAVVTFLAQHDDTYYGIDDLRLAFQLGHDAQQVAAILLALESMETETPTARISSLGSLSADPSLRGAIIGRLLAHDHKSLMQIASTQQLLIALGGQSTPNVESPESTEDWISDYPLALRATLKRLRQQTTRARRIAAEILGKDLPEPQRLQIEITAIEAKLDASAEEDPTRRVSHLRLRLTNLQERLKQPATLSPARMKTLTSKLDARVDHECIEQFVARCRQAIATIIRDRFQMANVPEELLRPPLDAVVADVLELQPSMRKLGMRLIFETLNRSTRRFDAEPANETFRAAMEAKGIKMHVWVGDEFVTTGMTADGSSYQLKFTRDVVDFLLMGFHFETCLSPGDFNFFSTVANAVDINKRVVYGKTTSGRIVGRCLFALNREGKILTFHRYAHDPEDGFAAAVDHFATSLAAAMNTQLAKRGVVQNLVANDWYDDGAVGVETTEMIDAKIRRLVQYDASSSIYDGLRELLSHEEIVNRIDELVAMEAFVGKPAAIRTLLDRLADDDVVTPSQRLVIARVAFRHAASELSMRLLARIPVRTVVGIARRTRCDYCSAFHGFGSYRDTFAMLVDFNPSTAIRVMRASRDKRLRDDLNDVNRQRRKALARAHRQLGRIEIAERLEGSK